MKKPPIPKLSLVSTNKPKLPEEADKSIRIILNDKTMSSLVEDGPEFLKLLQLATMETQIFIEVEKDFRTLDEINHFRHVIGFYINTIDLAKTAIMADLRALWYNLYYYLDTTKVVSTNIVIGYNLFGASIDVCLTVEGDLEVYSDENFYDTSYEKTITERFNPQVQEAALPDDH